MSKQYLVKKATVHQGSYDVAPIWCRSRYQHRNRYRISSSHRTQWIAKRHFNPFDTDADPDTGERLLNKQAGFTIMEVLIAVVILGLAYVALLENFSVSLRQIDRLKRARHSVLVETMDLDQKLRVGDEEEAFPSNKEKDAAIILEGKTHTLVVVTSEQGTFQSLKLEKKK